MPSPYQIGSDDPALVNFMQGLIAQQQQGGGNYDAMPQAASNVEVDPVLQMERMGRVQGAQSERAARAQQGRDLEMLEAKAQMEANIRAQEQGFTAQQAQLDRADRATQAQLDREARSSEAAADRKAREQAAARVNALNLQIQMAELDAARMGGAAQESALQRRDAFVRELNDYQDALTAATADVEKITPEARKAFAARKKYLEDQLDVHKTTIDRATTGIKEAFAQHISDATNSSTSGLGYTPMSGAEMIRSGIGQTGEILSEFFAGRDKVSDTQLIDAIAGGNLSPGVLAAYAMSQPEGAGQFIGGGSVADWAADRAGGNLENQSREWATGFIEQGLVRALGTSGQNINISAVRPYIQTLMSKLTAASLTPNADPREIRKDIMPLVQAIAREGFPGAEMSKQDYTPIVADILDSVLENASSSLRASGSELLRDQGGTLNLNSVRGGAYQFAGNEANKMRYVLSSALKGSVLNRKALESAVASMDKAMSPAGGAGQISVLRETLEGGPSDMATQDLLDLLSRAERSVVSAKEAGVQATAAEKKLKREEEYQKSQVQPRVQQKQAEARLRAVQKLVAEELRRAGQQ